MAADQTPLLHPVSRAVASVGAVLDDVAEVALWSMGAEEAGETLTALTRATARIAELTLRVAAHADTLHVGDESRRRRRRTGGRT